MHKYLWLLPAVAGLLMSCNRPQEPANTVVVYTSVDEPVARPILAEFARRTGIKLEIRTDAEATKTAGLAALMEAERDHPRADVYWGNEPFYTSVLAAKGIFQPYVSPVAAEIPARFKDADGRWAGSALRVRVLAVTDVAPGAAGAAGVRRLSDLSNPALKGRIAISRPTAGTVSGHVAALWDVLGEERARQLFAGWRANDMKLLGGNSEVSNQAGSGQIWAGLTDNDDVANTKAEGGKLSMVLPDQDPSDIGTLAFPCTVALLAKAPHGSNGRKLVDYLLSREVEKKLIDARYARYSVLAEDKLVKTMNVDYAKAAAQMPRAVAEATRILTGQ
jgi:iron(III) transport system substrate-binding protein